MFIATRAGVTASKAPPTALYTAFNPADKGVNIALSNGNLTGTSAGTGLARTVKGVGASEHKYWEVLVGAGPAGRHMHGLVATGVSVDVFPGSSASGVSWSGSGEVTTAGSIYLTTGTYKIGDVLGFDYNRAAGLLRFMKNGTYQDSISFAGPAHPAFGAYASSGVVATFNFGPTMAYPIPAGASLIAS